MSVPRPKPGLNRVSAQFEGPVCDAFSALYFLRLWHFAISLNVMFSCVRLFSVKYPGKLQMCKCFQTVKVWGINSLDSSVGAKLPVFHIVLLINDSV